MEARDVERQLLARCVQAARDPSTAATDAREANVFRLAGLVCGRPFLAERQRLLVCSQRFFDAHPGSRLEPGELVRRGWVVSLPRFRDMLREQLQQRHSA
jgi:hypothetical protein